MKHNVKTGLIGLFSIVFVSVGVFTPLAHAVTAVPVTGIAGKCLDVQGGVVKEANKVQLYSCNGTSAQDWEKSEDGTLRNQGFCLDIKRGGIKSKTPVWLYICNNSSAQQWSVSDSGEIINPASGLCLDSQYGGSKNRNPLWVYTCNQTDAQKWVMTVVVQKGAVESVTPAPVAAAVPRASEPVAPATASGGVVKMSNAGICHAPGTTYYVQTKNYTGYDNLRACLDAGGRMPKR